MAARLAKKSQKHVIEPEDSAAPTAAEVFGYSATNIRQLSEQEDTLDEDLDNPTDSPKDRS